MPIVHLSKKKKKNTVDIPTVPRKTGKKTQLCKLVERTMIDEKVVYTILDWYIKMKTHDKMD